MNIQPFIITRKGQPRQLGDKRAVIRVSEKTYTALCRIASESGRSIMWVADKAIAYAFQNIQLVDEESEVDPWRESANPSKNF